MRTHLTSAPIPTRGRGPIRMYAERHDSVPVEASNSTLVTDRKTQLMGMLPASFEGGSPT